MFVLSVITTIFSEINRLSSPNVPWFPIPMLAVALLSVYLCQRLNTRTQVAGSSGAFRKLVSVGALALFGIVVTGLYLSGWDAIRSGQIRLSGDSLDAPTLFQNIFSVITGLVSGLTEEAAIRGVVQLSIVGSLGSIRAQFVAGAVFILLHLFTKSGLNGFTFIGLVAFVSGLLTSKFRSVWLPATVHSLSNATIAMVVLACRH